MTTMNILTYPNPILNRPCQKIIEVNRRLIELAEDMAETMYIAVGIGLAAPQVGAEIQLAVIDIETDKNRRGDPLFLFNPRIVMSIGEIIYEERCLSVPDLIANVNRAARVVVEALDREGNYLTIEAEGLLAICLQHELDHLDGRLFLDKISPLKRALYKKRRFKQLNAKIK